LAELTVVQKFNQGVPAMAVHHCRGAFPCLPAGRFGSFPALAGQKKEHIRHANCI